MQNSLELHQPNMHIGYRVIPLSVHIVSLARSIFNGIWPILLQIFICCRMLWRRVRFSLRVSSLQPTCFACGTWRWWRLHEDYYFRCFALSKLASCYAICKGYFLRTGSSCNNWYNVVIFHLKLCVQMNRSRGLHYTQVPCQFLSAGTL